MGKNKQDSKPAAAKGKGKGGKGGGKGGGGDDSSDTKSSGKLKGGQSINVRHILCEKFAKSEEAIERLRNGDKFDAVAREMSEDKANKGGSLGWQTKGSLDPEFEKVAFELPPSPVTSPTFERVKTGFGYHIIMVEERK